MFANTDWYLFNFRLPLARALREESHSVTMISPGGAFASRIQSAGFAWARCDFSRAGVNPLSELFTIFRLIMIYRRLQPDVVHHFTIKCVLYGSIAARFHKGTQVINAVTGLGHVFTSDTLRNRVLRPVVRWLYRIALSRSQVIFQNPEDMDAMLALGVVHLSQCHLIRGSGVNTSRFTPRGASDTRRKITVVMVARLLREKGIIEFVEAAKKINSAYQDVEFVIAGDQDSGNPTSLDSSTLESWRQFPWLKLKGHVDDIPNLLRESDIAVLPSYREGTPRSLLEAAACGLPIVATDVPGCREIVKHGVNGLLVPPMDALKLAEAIMSLIKDKSMRTRFGTASRDLVLSQFDERIVFSQTMKVYEIALRTSDA